MRKKVLVKFTHLRFIHGHFVYYKRMPIKNIFLTILLIVSSACRDQGVEIYKKFVYDFPRNEYPFEAVTEVEIYAARLQYRTLVNLNPQGFLVNDIAESISTSDNKAFSVKLKDKQKFRSGKTINAKSVVEAFTTSIKKSKDPILLQIMNMKILNDLTFEIRLKQEEVNFVRQLSSHLFSIFDPSDLRDVSGSYFMVGKNRFQRVTDNKLPKILSFDLLDVEKAENIFKTSEAFDTALAYTSTPKLEKQDYRINYRVQETWGLVLNLKDRFSSRTERRCLNSSVPRDHIIKEALVGHTKANSLNNLREKVDSCSDKMEFSILIPTEIEEKGKKFCKTISKVHNIKCIYVSFSELLSRLKGNQFEAALISLTTDDPFVETYLNYLDPKSRFSIVNKAISIPETLKNSYGADFYKQLEAFLFEEALFISISHPIRTIFASKSEEYKPSLISPAYDSLENLKR